VPLRLDELARLVGGRVTNAAAAPTVITGAASISEAQEGEITFFGNARYLSALRSTKASCVLVPEGFAEEIPTSLATIEVANPSLAFSQVLEQFAPAPICHRAGIHPSAIIDSEAEVDPSASIAANAVIEAGAKVGAGSIIGAGCYIGHNARIGEQCHLHPNVTVYDRTVIGDRVIVHGGTTIGSDGFGFEMNQGRHVKIPQIGIVQIDNDVEVGANVVIDRARFGRTWIGEGTKIDNLVQIAHNVVIGKHSLIISQTGISGSARIGNYVTLAGQVGVVGHIEVGDQAIVAAKTGISKSIAGKQVYWGTPAVPLREEKERLAFINRIPKLWEKVKRLEALVEKLAGKTGE